MNNKPNETTNLEARDYRRSRRQERRAQRGGTITGGVLLIGLGMLLLSGWWWPGIMLVLGAASAAELMRRGQIWAAIGTFLSFAAIPLGIAIIQAIDIPWLPVGAFILIGLGLLALARAISAQGGAQ